MTILEGDMDTISGTCPVATGNGAAALDMTDADLLRDPFRGYSLLRERDRIVRAVYPTSPTPLWLITRYDDVKMVLGDQRFANNPGSVPGANVDDLHDELAKALGLEEKYIKIFTSSLLDADGEDHVRLRRLVSRTFTARRVAALRPRVEEIAARLLDQLGRRAEADDADGVGVVDLIENFAYLLPINVICELIGIPEADWPRWRQWGRAAFSLEPGAQNEPMRGMVDHITELVEQRRAVPTGDLLSGLIEAHDEEGDRLTGDELITMVLTLVLAGTENTAHMIGNGTLALLTHPDQLGTLQADPALMPAAVQELMRWCGPLHGTQFRHAVEDVEIGGVTIRQGDRLMCMLVAANYDPRYFSDPDRLDLRRQPDSLRETHVGFGAGLHYCLGAHLAKQEFEVAFSGLLTRFPNMELAVPAEELERQNMPGSWRLRRLPLRLHGTPRLG
ncbi:cytochrome P450 family protein [Micromonospora rifamycinica]|nr:cytochrome P450 [Micromonospora rifamycinica]